MVAPRTQRAVFLALILLFSGIILHQYVSAGPFTAEYPYEDEAASGATVAGERANYTVVTSDDPGRIIVLSPDGSIAYYNNSLDEYYDVDPLDYPYVAYVAQEKFPIHRCPRTETSCTFNILERLNIRTGETERLYTYYTAGRTASEWHDVDIIGDGIYLVAAIKSNRVFIYNQTTGMMPWGWDAQEDFPVEGGGPYPRDWTHLNDVELLDDGRIMVSLRNQDQVVFLSRTQGLLEDWTLGAEDDHSILYEQHNPDYIPEELGGPAVVIGDSENNRVVEYQREDGAWNRSWVWQDEQMQWARDGDRLPNCHTLVTDTHGYRVFELDENADIAWDFSPLQGTYDAERIGTGDGSAGGPSAVECGIPSKSVGATTGSESAGAAGLKLQIRRTVPNKILNAVLYVKPFWMDMTGVLAVLAIVLLLLLWAGIELHRSGHVTFRSPVSVEL